MSILREEFLRSIRLSIAALAMAAILAPIATAAAQRPTPRQPVQDAVSPAQARAFFGVGWRQVDVTDLNASITAAGFPAFSRDFAMVGGGAQLVAGRFLLGFEGAGLFGTGSQVSRDEFDAHLNGGYGVVSLGVLAVNTRTFRLYPTASIGGGAMTLEITEGGRFSFDEILLEPRRSSRLNQASAVLGVGIGAEFLVPVEPRTRRRTLSIGLDGGYSIAPFTSRWYLHGGSTGTAAVIGGPDVGIEGAHVRLSLGFVGPRRR